MNLTKESASTLYDVMVNECKHWSFKTHASATAHCNALNELARLMNKPSDYAVSESRFHTVTDPAYCITVRGST